jgi:two-component system, NarL family, sensor kinase
MGDVHMYNIIDEISLSYHLENSPLGVIAFNKELQIVFWSDKATEIFEWNSAETLHQSITTLNLVYEEDLEEVSKKIHEITFGIHHYNQNTNRNYTKSGRLIYCDWYNSALKDASGNITSILCFIHDVTEGKNAVQALEESQNQLSLIYNSAIDPMWLISIEGENQFRFENINASFTQVTGLERHQVVGLLMEQVLPPSSHGLVRTKYNEAIKTGKEIDYVEIAVHPAGERIGEIRVIPVKDAEGNVTKLVGIANDITEKYALQKKLDRERDELRKKITAAAIQSQEVERSSISRELHDNVNQVLTTVKLYTELLTSGSVDPLTYLPKCTILLNDTINEIRRISKQLAVPTLSNVGIKDVLKDLVELVQETQQLDIELQIDAPHCDQIDEELQLAIYRITQEQLTNILKHANAEHVLVKLQASQTYLTLTIADNGVGFNTRQKANGIGITNMTSRAHLLNGVLAIKSSKGKGSTLTASFPVKYAHGKCFPVSV